MSTNNKITRIFLIAILFAASVAAQTPYDEGQKALREQRWKEAAEQFELAIESGSEQADAAMYWRAHALYKAGRNSHAERQIRSLERTYPESYWLKEAQVLQIEFQDPAKAVGNVPADLDGDEELRLFALAQLMERDPARALPMVLDLLRHSESESIRRDALFVLGMSDSEEAQQAIAEFVRDSDNPDLQADAISMVGVASEENSLAILEGLYTESASQEVKESVIQAYVVSGQTDALMKLLEIEKDPDLQVDIIHALGMLEAVEQLRQIYPTLTDKDTKLAALEAFFLADDSEMLMQVLETETDSELRSTAIEGLAMQGGTESAALIESMYDSASTVDEKMIVLEALFMMDNAKDLALKILQTESDPELTVAAIEVLGVTGATNELADMYSSISEPELREAILESMVMASDSDGLIRVLGQEQDSELRALGVQALSMIDHQAALAYMSEMYPEGSREHKEAVLQAMMINGDAAGLIELLKQEKDPELKRLMMEMLAIMDSDEANDYLFELLESEG